MLMQFMYDFTRTVLASMSFSVQIQRNNPGQLLKNEVDNEQALKMLRLLADCYVKRRRFPVRPKLHEEKIWQAGRITRSAKSFVLAHELGHVVYQHKSANRALQQELEADEWATTTLKRRDSRIPEDVNALEPSEETIGPLFALSLQRLIEETFRGARRNPMLLFGAFLAFPGDLSTHPAARDRWQVLHERFSQVKGRYGLDFGRHANELVDKCGR
jgi:hypothetical protein